MTQRELIAAAFAGDDVQAEFDAEKAAEAEAEAPAVEEPSQLPGWGNWADRQREPAWLLSAKAQAQQCVPSATVLLGSPHCVTMAAVRHVLTSVHGRLCCNTCFRVKRRAHVI